jgi:hypothetical protein
MDPVLIGTGFFGLALIVWFFCAYIAYQRAPERRRRPGVWGALGIFFGPIALFALFLLPKGNEEVHAAAGHKHTSTQADLYEVTKKKHRG